MTFFKLSFCLFFALFYSNPTFAKKKVRAKVHALAQVITDMNLGETIQVGFKKKQLIKIKLATLKENRDSVRNALRSAKVELEIEGIIYPVYCENYTLPKDLDAHGIKVECLATKGLNLESLKKDVRLRFYPISRHYFYYDQFMFPLESPLFSNDTQLGNEPVFVNGGESIGEKFYYHDGVDLGGMEGIDLVFATCAGTVVASGKSVLKEFKKIPVVEVEDSRVTILDSRGWYHIYTHLKKINSFVSPGKKVKAGEQIGILGKEGNSGGWAHLHYDIKTKLKEDWASINPYPFLWEASRRKFKTRIAAIARPHRLAKVGEEVFFHSWFSYSGLDKFRKHEWFFPNGDIKTGVEVTNTFKTPGIYTVILKIEDIKGRIDYDFAKVQIVDPSSPETKYPTLHAAYDLINEQLAMFKVKVFNAQVGELKINYGDESTVETMSLDSKNEYLDTQHTFKKSGKYLVTFDYSEKNKTGRTIIEVDIPNAIPLSWSKPNGIPYKGKLENGKCIDELTAKYPTRLISLSPGQFQYASEQMFKLLEGIAQWNSGAPLCIGDISKKGGGKLARHVLHQRGLDVDLAFIPKKAGANGHRVNKFHNKFPETFISKNGISENFAREENFRLFAYIARNFDVGSIWVNEAIYDSLASNPPTNVSEEDRELVLSILRSDDSHVDHFHVRLTCPPNVKDCVD